MSVTNFHTSFSKGNNTAIIHNNMSQFGWGPFLGLNARGPFNETLTNDVVSFEQPDLVTCSTLRYFQYGFPYHAGDNNMIFKDKLKSTPE